MVGRGPKPRALQRYRLARLVHNCDSHEVFIPDHSTRRIEVDPAGHTVADYGLISRVVNAETGQFVVQAGGPVKTIADIRGKMVGFGDNASTSSHLIPRALLARNGLIGDRDYKYVHLGAHDAVARAVQAGQVQAGGLSQEIFNRLVAKGTIDGAKVIVLAESDPIPNYPMVMQGDLAPPLKDAIRKSFLDLKDPTILKTFRAEGFTPTDDKAYDILRETARVLDLDLTTLRG